MDFNLDTRHKDLHQSVCTIIRLCGTFTHKFSKTLNIHHKMDKHERGNISSN